MEINGAGKSESKPSWISAQEHPVPTVSPTTLASKSRRVWKTVAPAVALLAILLVAAGLYFNSRKARALTMQDSIVVADFANTTGDEIFDGTLRQALAVDLGQSPYLNVVSDRRVAAALKEMEKPVARGCRVKSRARFACAPTVRRLLPAQLNRRVMATKSSCRR